MGGGGGRDILEEMEGLESRDGGDASGSDAGGGGSDKRESALQEE